jgi:DNA-binding response OmpR family regulator
MEYKRLREFASQMELGIHGIPTTTTAVLEGQESSAVALLEDAMLPFSGQNIPFGLKPAEWNESDNYQVALVPVGSKVERASRTSQATMQTKHVLVLPLTWKELVVRLRAGVHASGSGRESGIVRFGDVFADFYAMEVTRANETVTLTTLEFKLFRFLVQNAGRVVSREEMLNEVWGYENYPCTRTVDNHILRLRQKLEADPARPVHFHTVHGVGYKFVREVRRGVPEHKM